MTSDRESVIERICSAALERDASSRSSFLDEACAGDDALRREVESLLAHEGTAEVFLGRPALEDIGRWAAVTDALVVGQSIGSYSILSRLGAGGMGEVYRARDQRLGREVAIKVLPAMFTVDPARLARFEREARMLAALNHPNIAAIYGVEEADGVRALVLELVEGETLANRLTIGPLALHEALIVAQQMARALDAAHGRGIIHRDLKPANIKITPGGVVKLLDFGLAKVRTSNGVGSDPSQSAAVSIGGTADGALLGTVAYMSPEQARGKPLDRRTDIWAFGCVLYEMLTGRSPFVRDTISDSIAAILERTPDWKALPTTTPPMIKRLLQRCLDKDIQRRIGGIGDAHAEIDEALGSLVTPRPSRRALGLLGVAAGAAIVVAGATVARKASRVPAAPLPVQLTHFSTSVRDPAISPDGRLLAYIVVEPSGTDAQIFVQALPDGKPQQLTHTAGLKAYLAFSPDGSRIAYTITGEAWKWDTWVTPVVGGVSRLLLPNAAALQWLKDGRVLFSEFRRGPQLAVVVAGESRAGEHDIYVPPPDGMAHYSDPSPDEQHLVIGEMRASGLYVDRAPLACFISSMHSAEPQQRVGTAEIPCSMFVRWSRDGRWLYFASGRGSQFQLFRESAAGGRPEQITAGTGLAVRGLVTSFALAPDGRSVVYPSGEGQETIWVHAPDQTPRQLTFEDSAFDPHPSADGQRVFYIAGPRFTAGQIWARTLDSSRSEQICTGFEAFAVVPSPDGRIVVFAHPDAHGKVHLWLGAVDNASAPRELAGGDHDLGNPLFSPDGQTIVYVERTAGGNSRVWRVGLDGSGLRPLTDVEPSLVIRGVSPDGRWVSVTRGSLTPREAWVYPIDGSRPPRRLWKTWEFSWTATNRNILLTNSGMVSSAWLVPNRTGEMVPQGLWDNPTEEAMAKAGGRRVLSADFFVTPTPMPDGLSVIFSRVDNHSNLYRLTLSN